MRRIDCCGKGRLVNAITWIYSHVEGFDRFILYEAFCPHCKRDRLVKQTFTFANGRGSRELLKGDKMLDWLKRKVTQFERTQEPPKEILRPSTQEIYVGEFTARISRGGRAELYEVNQAPPPQELVGIGR